MGGITVVKETNFTVLRLTNHTTPVRIGEKLLKELEDIAVDRVKKGIDRKTRSAREMLNLITYHSSWQEIKKDMLNFKFPENKR